MFTIDSDTKSHISESENNFAEAVRLSNSELGHSGLEGSLPRKQTSSSLITQPTLGVLAPEHPFLLLTYRTSRHPLRAT